MWLCGSFFRFGKYLVIIYSNTFSITSYVSFSGIPIRHRLAYFILSHRSLGPLEKRMANLFSIVALRTS